MVNATLEERIQIFFHAHKKVQYKKGAVLIHAQEDPSGVFYIEAGHVKQYVISKKGEESVLNIYKPKAFFPMTWALNESPNVYDFEAIDSVDAFIASRTDVVRFLQKNPDVTMDLLQRILRGSEGMLLRMSFLLSGSAYRRTITELLIAAKRFGKTSGTGQTVKLHLKETDIATQAGLTRETVSRQVSLLKDKKLVLFEKGVLSIPDLSELEKELSDSSYE